MQRSDVLQVVETEKAIFFLTIQHEEGDLSQASGHVYAIEKDRNSTKNPEAVFSSNQGQTISPLWASPSGYLWIGTSAGAVGTTSTSVPWPAIKREYQALGETFRWQAARLPTLSSGLLPNITAMWGVDDNMVFIGANGGHIYRWDGKDLALVHEGSDDGVSTIRRIGGTGPNDVYALALDGAIWHFDGNTWKLIPRPEPKIIAEGMMAVVPAGDGDVLMCGNGQGSRLIKGNATEGFTEILRTQQQLMDMAFLNGELFFSIWEGVGKQQGSEIQVLKSTFKTARMREGIGRLFFIEPSPGQTCFIEYDPRRADEPWWRYTF